MSYTYRKNHRTEGKFRQMVTEEEKPFHYAQLFISALKGNFILMPWGMKLHKGVEKEKVLPFENPDYLLLEVKDRFVIHTRALEVCTLQTLADKDNRFYIKHMKIEERWDSTTKKLLDLPTCLLCVIKSSGLFYPLYTDSGTFKRMASQRPESREDIFGGKPAYYFAASEVEWKTPFI